MNQHFASDNYAGICPSALHYLLEANNSGHELAYGDDSWTTRVCNQVRELFATDCDVYFVFNGTAANSLSLATICSSYQSIICHQLAHIETDECGAPEFFSHGAKILCCGGENGKLTPDTIRQQIERRSDVHFPKAKALSLTQATETGSVYSVNEITELCSVAHRFGLKVHMDGARFANAVARLGCTPAELTWQAGVDVLCFGGTKNGLPVGEMVIFFDRQLSIDFDARAKQVGQLASKMRFISAPWLGLLENDQWLKNAQHANSMADRLYDLLIDCPQIKIKYPVEANSIFVDMPAVVAEQMRQIHGWRFYDFIATGGCRLMCAWDTEPETVDRFAFDLIRIASSS